MKAGKVVLALTLLLLAMTTFAQKKTKNQQEIQLLTDNVFHLSEVMLHDVAAPVTASRFYAYALLAAYEVAYFSKGNLPNINEKFNVNPGINPPPVPKNFNLSLGSSYAILEVGRHIMPSGNMLIENQKKPVSFF